MVHRLLIINRHQLRMYPCLSAEMKCHFWMNGQVVYCLRTSLPSKMHRCRSQRTHRAACRYVTRHDGISGEPHTSLKLTVECVSAPSACGTRWREFVLTQKRAILLDGEDCSWHIVRLGNVPCLFQIFKV